MTSDIERKYGCKVSHWSMPLIHFDEFVDGKLVSVPCSEATGEFFQTRLMEQYVRPDNENHIVDADFTVEGDQGWLALVVDDEDAVDHAARILSQTVDRPVDWRDN